MNNTQYRRLKTLLVIVGTLCGFFIVTQFRSFRVAEHIIRDSDSDNIFREIQVLKLTNDELEGEIADLLLEKENLTDGRSYRESIITALEKNRVIAGLVPVVGPGIVMTIDKKIAVSWLVDTENELWTAGAEAVSFNGIRLSPYTQGFEDFNGQIYLNKQAVRAPYKIETIGNIDILEKILVQRGSIVARIKSVYPDINVTVSPQPEIQMTAVK